MLSFQYIPGYTFVRGSGRQDRAAWQRMKRKRLLFLVITLAFPDGDEGLKARARFGVATGEPPFNQGRGPEARFGDIVVELLF